MIKAYVFKINTTTNPALSSLNETFLPTIFDQAETISMSSVSSDGWSIVKRKIKGFLLFATVIDSVKGHSI